MLLRALFVCGEALHVLVLDACMGFISRNVCATRQLEGPEKKTKNHDDELYYIIIFFILGNSAFSTAQSAKFAQKIF